MKFSLQVFRGACRKTFPRRIARMLLLPALAVSSPVQALPGITDIVITVSGSSDQLTLTPAYESGAAARNDYRAEAELNVSAVVFTLTPNPADKCVTVERNRQPSNLEKITSPPDSFGMSTMTLICPENPQTHNVGFGETRFTVFTFDDDGAPSNDFDRITIVRGDENTFAKPLNVTAAAAGVDASNQSLIKVSWPASTGSNAEHIAQYRILVLAKDADLPANGPSPLSTLPAPGGNSARTHTFSIVQSAFILQPRTEYDIYVRSETSNGEIYSPWSDKVTVTTGSLKPSAPANLALDFAARGAMTLTWSPPPDPADAPVTSYRLRHRTAGAQNWIEQSLGDVTRHTVTTGLQAGQDTQVELSAANKVGAGAATTATQAVIWPPAAPRINRLQPGNEMLVLSWTPPPVEHATAPIISFSVRWKLTTAADFDSSNLRTAPADASADTIPGLTNGAAYDVEVAAINSVGEGAWARAQATPSALNFPAQPDVRAHGGAPFSQTLPAAGGGTAPYGYTLEGAPAELQFAADTRVLSGTPAAPAATQLFTLTYTARDSASSPLASTQKFTLRIAPPLAFDSSLRALTFTFNDSASAATLPGASGGYAPYTFALSGAPSGMAFAADTRMLAGAPDRVGNSTLTYAVTDAEGIGGAAAGIVRGEFAVSVTPAPPGAPDSPSAAKIAGNYARISWNAPADTGGENVRAYLLRWAAAGDAANYLNAGGASGMPVASATQWTIFHLNARTQYLFAVAAVNSAGAGEFSTALSVTTTTAGGLRIAPQPGVTFTAGETVTPVTLPAASGGSGDANYNYTIGNLPDGLTFNTRTRIINGAPTARITRQESTAVAYTVTDSAADESLAQNFLITIITPGALLFHLPATGDVRIDANGDAVSLPLAAAAGGRPPYSYALAGLPPLLSFNAAAHTISGTPAVNANILSEIAAREYALVYTVTDASSLPAIERRFVLRIRTHPFSLDIDAHGGVTAADGIMIARRLLGVSGDSLTNGQSNAVAEEVASRIANGVLNKQLDVNADDAANSVDGFLIARYLLGLRGANLLGDFNGDAGDIRTAINALRAAAQQ